MRLEHLPEPILEFGSLLPYPVFDPVYGISRLGPYDYTRERGFSTITVMAIGPETQKEPFQDLWIRLLSGVERKQYEPRYERGLAAIYRLEQVSLARDHEGYLAIESFSGTTEEKYCAAIRYLKENCGFDILFIVEPEQRIYYLHNLLRRECISLQMPSQYLEAETLSLRV